MIFSESVSRPIHPLVTYFEGLDSRYLMYKHLSMYTHMYMHMYMYVWEILHMLLMPL